MKMDYWAGSISWACQKHTEMLIRFCHLKLQHLHPGTKQTSSRARTQSRAQGGKGEIRGWRSASRALSQLQLPPMDLNGSFLICLERWLEAAWQCLLGRQFLAHRFIWAGQFALILRHSDKNALNHWQSLGCREGQWLNQQHPQGRRRRKMF